MTNLKTFDCCAFVKSINPPYKDQFVLIQKDYKAENLDQAIKGFTEYLQTNKNYIDFYGVLVV